MKSVASAKRDQRITSTLRRIRYKLFVISGKGGVGKSSVAVNVAAGLSSRGYRVGVLDVDMHGPSVPGLLGLKGGLEASGVSGVSDGGEFARISPKRYSDTLHVVSLASLLEDPDQTVLWRGPMKTAAIRQFMADVEWGCLDFLVIDSPPGTGDEHLAILKTIPDALCVVVTTPQEVSLADVRKVLNFLQYSNANILGVVENMSGLVCPWCGQDIDLFKKGGGRELAGRHGLPFLGAIPLDPATVVAADLGMPVVLLPEDTPAKRAMLELVDRIVIEASKSLEVVATSHQTLP